MNNDVYLFYKSTLLGSFGTSEQAFRFVMRRENNPLLTIMEFISKGYEIRA